MISEAEIEKRYNGIIDELNRLDGMVESETNVEWYEVYDRCVAEYVLLHEILEIEGEPKWNY